jgi:hypothetical protein
VITMTRPVAAGHLGYAYPHLYGRNHPHAGRPLPGGTQRITGPLPVTVPGQDVPYAGMDPSNPATWVRPWNPQPGMIGRLNFDGAQLQARQPAGGVQRGRQQRKRGYR